MANPDLLQWTHHASLRCYGVQIAIRTNDMRVMEALPKLLPPHSKMNTRGKPDSLYSVWLAPPTRSGRKPFHLLYSNEEQTARLRDPEILLLVLEREIQMAVAQKARRKVFVHAGVVGWRGSAIIIPAKSYAGKSTLVHALVRAGATYYSDEYAVLDEFGRVHPFARPLALRDETKVNRKMSFEELGGKIGKRAIPVGTILATKYRERAKWRPQALTPGLGALELLANCVVARTGDPFVLQVLSRTAKQANILKSARGEADTFALQLLDSLA